MKSYVVLVLSSVAKTLRKNPFLAFIETFTYLITYLSLFFVLSISDPGIIFKATDPFTGKEYTGINDERIQNLLMCLAAIVIGFFVVKVLLNAVSENEKDTAAIYYLSGGGRKSVKVIWFLQNEFFWLVAMIIGWILTIPFYDFLENDISVVKDKYAALESTVLMLIVSFLVYRHISKQCEKIRFVRNLR